jgi:DNA polymerase III delta prime subunit
MYDPEITTILGRDEIRDTICKLIQSPENYVFIYGRTGTGKTALVESVLVEYDVMYYNAADMRNKNIFDEIAKMSNTSNNVVHMFQKKVRQTVVVIDELESVNTGDRSTINSLIKMIQKKPSCSIVCICNQQIDKKISDLMKHCHVFFLEQPTHEQMRRIMQLYKVSSEELIYKSNSDLRKLMNNISTTRKVDVKKLCEVLYLNDSILTMKNIVRTLMSTKKTPEESQIFNTDVNRMMLSLIWHENIIDYLDPEHFQDQYFKFLTNMCISDCIDRVAFHRQLWNLSEMTSITKVLHNHWNISPYLKCDVNEIRFTKVLTKYSSEYNNHFFIQGLCNRHGCDRDTLFKLANEANAHTLSSASAIFTKPPFKMTQLEAKRLYKFINKIDYVFKEDVVVKEEVDSSDFDI